MNKIAILQKSCIGLLLLLLVTSCTTDDILPTIEISASSLTLNEASGETTITVTLNSDATETFSVPLTFSGTATQSVDYSVSASAIIINAGSNSGSITITGLQDTSIEGIETLIVSLENVQNALVLSDVSITIQVLDDDSDTDNDGVPDSEDNCPTIAGEIENNGCPWLGFLINEVLYDPDTSIAGDANGDGTREANEDEFIEFFNSGLALDVSGYTVSDETAIRHTFPAGTIIPKNGVLVLFGGGVPTGTFGGAIVQTASQGLLNMNNAGDIVTVRDASGTVIITFDIYPLSDNPNVSFTRNPDLTGDFVEHTTISAANGAMFSPGTKLDGTSF